MCYSGWTVYGYSILDCILLVSKCPPDELRSCYVGYEHLTALQWRMILIFLQPRPFDTESARSHLDLQPKVLDSMFGEEEWEGSSYLRILPLGFIDLHADELFPFPRVL